jgi:hypothetical protein
MWVTILSSGYFTYKVVTRVNTHTLRWDAQVEVIILLSHIHSSMHFRWSCRATGSPLAQSGDPLCRLRRGSLESRVLTAYKYQGKKKLKTILFYIKIELEVPRTENMKMTVFCDVAPCSLVKVYWRFRGVTASIIRTMNNSKDKF